jgi:hypothetical protein
MDPEAPSMFGGAADPVDEGFRNAGNSGAITARG